MAETARARIVVSAVDDATAGIRRINDQVRGMTEPIGRVRRSVDRLNSEFRELSEISGAAKIRRQLSGVADSARRASAGIGTSAQRLTRIAGSAGIIGGAAGGGIGLLINRTVEAGDETAKLSRQVGLNIERLQEWRFAASQAGVEQNTFNKSMEAFSKRLGELQSGQGRLRSTLEETNPALLRQLETTEDSQEAFKLVTDAIAQARSEAQKNNLAAAAFSRAGQRMTRFASLSADEIGRLSQRARDLGIVISEDQARGAEKFADQAERAQKSLQGLGFAIGFEVLPQLRPMLKDFTEFIKANRELIATRVGDFITDVASKMRGLLDPSSQIRQTIADVAGAVRGAVGVFRALAEAIGPVTTGLVTFGAVIFGPAIAGVGAFIGSIVKLSTTMVSMTATLGAAATGLRVLKIALISTGIGALIVGIGTAISLVISNWSSLVDTVISTAKSIANAVAGVANIVPGIDIPRFGDDATKQAQSEADKVKPPKIQASREIQEVRKQRTVSLDDGRQRERQGRAVAAPGQRDRPAVRQQPPQRSPAVQDRRAPDQGRLSTRDNRRNSDRGGIVIERLEPNITVQGNPSGAAVREMTEELFDQIEEEAQRRGRGQLF